MRTGSYSVGEFPSHVVRIDCQRRGRAGIQAAQQLALLNDRPIATEVARYVCRLDGPLGSLEALEGEGASEILSALAEIDADAVLTLLDRVVGLLSVEGLREVKGNTRRHLVWALEKIAFLEATFERAALLLLSLAAAENETRGNNATGQFKCLFPVFLRFQPLRARKSQPRSMAAGFLRMAA